MGYSADLLEGRNGKMLGYSAEHVPGNCLIYSKVCPVTYNRNDYNLSIVIAVDIMHVGIGDYDWIRGLVLPPLAYSC